MAIKCPTFNSGQSVSKTATIGPMLLFFLLLMVYLLRKRKILAFWAVSNLLAVGFRERFKHVVGRLDQT